jgi:hypothetical protein
VLSSNLPRGPEEIHESPKSRCPVSDGDSIRAPPEYASRVLLLRQLAR